MVQARTQADLLKDLGQGQNLDPDDFEGDLGLDDGALEEGEPYTGDNLQEALISMGATPEQAQDLGAKYVHKSAFTKKIQESQSTAQQAVALAQQIQQQAQAGQNGSQAPQALSAEEAVKKYVRESAGEEVDEGTVTFLEGFAEEIIRQTRSEQQQMLAPVVQSAQNQAVESTLAQSLKEMTPHYGSGLEKVWEDVTQKVRERYQATGQWSTPEQILWNDFPQVAAALKAQNVTTQRQQHREDLDPGILEGQSRISMSQPLPLAQSVKAREKDMSPAAVTKRALAIYRRQLKR